MVAPLHDGGILHLIALNVWGRIGISSARKVLHHSEEKPSGPGDLFAFSLEIAVFNFCYFSY